MIYVINFVFHKYQKNYNRRFVLCREKGKSNQTIRMWMGMGNIKKTLGRKTIHSIISILPTQTVDLGKREEEEEKEKERRIISSVLDFFGTSYNKDIGYHIVYTKFR